MPTDIANRRYRFAFVLVLTLVVLGVFIAVIRDFLLDLMLAAVFAGMLDPFNTRCARWFRGRRGIAAGFVVLVCLLAFALPLVAVISVAGTQAVQLSESTAHWVQYIVDHPTRIASIIPDWIVPDAWVRQTIRSLTSGASDIVRTTSLWLSKNISTVTQSAIAVFIHLFVMFYALFYFLLRGPEVLDSVLNRMPLAKDEGHAVAHKIVVTASATLKSVVVIGLLQGALMGIAFAVVDIGQPLFWAAMTVVASIIPSLGPKIIWVPASIILLLTGNTANAIGLALWGALVIDMVDNIVRPMIVGRDAAIPDYLVLVSTLGGLLVFGVPGLIVGPVLAAVLLALLDLYYSVMRSAGLSNDAE